MKTKSFGSLGLGDEFRFVPKGPIYSKCINDAASVNRGAGQVGARELATDLYKRGYTRDSVEVYPVALVPVYSKPYTEEEAEGMAEVVRPDLSSGRIELVNGKAYTRWFVRFHGETNEVSRLIVRNSPV